MFDEEEVALYGGHGPQPLPAHHAMLAARAMATGSDVASATPQVDDHDATPIAIEGPYYKPYSPKRYDFREPGETGQVVELTGTILNRMRQPMNGATVDLWHASKLGEYDNSGFRYRGHIVTNADGKYRFLTIKPGGYGSFADGTGRTIHYHIIVRAPNVWPFTTQLYFPNEPDNQLDDYFRRQLVMNVQPRGEGFAAQFDIVLETFHTS